jgi:hypothetical protein
MIVRHGWRPAWGFSLLLVIHLRLSKAIRRLGALTFLALFASTGAAFASCPSQAVSAPFSPWGDTNSYFLVPGGSFEGTADEVGWSLSNASLTPGNEPFFVNAPTDSQALTIDAGGSATSPYFCVDRTMQSLRLFVQQVAGGSDLKVEALVQRTNGVAVKQLADLGDGSVAAWAPTEPILGNSGALPTGVSVMVALRFSAPGLAGSWQVDDVHVDPYRSG